MCEHGQQLLPEQVGSHKKKKTKIETLDDHGPDVFVDLFSTVGWFDVWMNIAFEWTLATNYNNDLCCQQSPQNHSPVVNFCLFNEFTTPKYNRNFFVGVDLRVPSVIPIFTIITTKK